MLVLLIGSSLSAILLIKYDLMNLAKKVILIIGGILCVLGLGYFIYANFKDTKTDAARINSEQQVSETPMEVSKPVTQQELYSEFSSLYSLDDKYIAALANPISNAAQLDSLQRIIQQMEKSLRHNVDSLNQAKERSSGKKDEQLSFFEDLLENRTVLRLTGGADGNNPGINTDASAQELKTSLLKKNLEVIELQRKLAEGNGSGNDAYPANEMGELQQRLAEKDNDLKALQTKFAVVDQQNHVYTKRIADIEKASGGTKSAAGLPSQEKLAELEASLRLAQVDCNLTRADGREIISSSKQRKALLEESLRILNNLSTSNNISVQQQVRDKQKELNRIATTIRD